jgi:hypothetical protein
MRSSSVISLPSVAEVAVEAGLHDAGERTALPAAQIQAPSMSLF